MWHIIWTWTYYIGLGRCGRKYINGVERPGRRFGRTFGRWEFLFKKNVTYLLDVDVLHKTWTVWTQVHKWGRETRTQIWTDIWTLSIYTQTTGPISSKFCTSPLSTSRVVLKHEWPPRPASNRGHGGQKVHKQLLNQFLLLKSSSLWPLDEFWTKKIYWPQASSRSLL